MRPSVFYISPCAAVVPSLTTLTHPTSFSLCVSLLAMSHLDFHVYPGSGQHLHEHYGYSQSVKVGSQVVISGQGEFIEPSGQMVMVEVRMQAKQGDR